MFIVDSNYSVTNANSTTSNDSLVSTFSTIYPFTNENVAGYMGDLDLTNKKIVTVAGSGDHVINSISRGATDITVFDINPLAKYYLDLKIAAIRNLSYHDYVHTFMFQGFNMNSEQINRFDIPKDSKEFWLENLASRNDDWVNVRRSNIFNPEYIEPKLVYLCNLYFDEYIYEEIKKRLENTNINFLITNVKDLKLDQKYDYMFLSNISDYIDLMYYSNPAENYAYLIKNFLNYVQTIYLSYLYDVSKDNLNIYEKDLKIFKKILGEIELKLFETSISVPEPNKIKDGVFVVTRK